MMLDLAALREKRITFEALCADLTVADLHRLTDEMIDLQLNLVSTARDADLLFLPTDPEAADPYAADPSETNQPWTLGHVIVHATASSEECAAQASSLARGVPTAGRARREVPWQTVTTIDELRQRLEESRRMRHAFLDAWPSQPDLSNAYLADRPGAKPRNAIQRFVAGLAHDDAHLDQIAGILRQSHASS